MCVFVCEWRGENMTGSGVRITVLWTSHSVNVTHALAWFDWEQNAGVNNSEAWGLGLKPEITVCIGVSCQNRPKSTGFFSVCADVYLFLFSWGESYLTGWNKTSANLINITATVVNTGVWPWSALVQLFNLQLFLFIIVRSNMAFTVYMCGKILQSNKCQQSAICRQLNYTCKLEEGRSKGETSSADW